MAFDTQCPSPSLPCSPQPKEKQRRPSQETAICRKKTSSNNYPQKIHGDKNEKHHFDPSGEIGRGGIGGGGKCNCFSRLQTYLAHKGFSSSVELVGGLILLHCFPAHVRGFSFWEQAEGNSTKAAVEGTRGRDRMTRRKPYHLGKRQDGKSFFWGERVG